jgi:Ca2+-transporting ATPase
VATPSPVDRQGATTGLSHSEAAARLVAQGPNRLPQDDHHRWPQVVASVVREPMILLLIGAAGVYALLGDAAEAWVLAVSVLLVAALTVQQEMRSERALQALRDLSSPRARVLRDAQPCVVAASEVVVGDVLLIEEGDRVAADARLVEGQEVVVDESLLTGESVPVRRAAGPGGNETMALIHASTLVVKGRGRAIVTATGDRTAVGRIGRTLRDVRVERTPLQQEMRRVVAIFAVMAFVACAAVAALHYRSHGDALQALLAGITLAVATIPEEFPVVLAVFLAMGAWRMARHRALVRRAPAIEALGSVTVLCTDKTGTLTQNRMAVAELVSGEDSSRAGEPRPQVLEDLLATADLACPEHPTDPMERALREAAGNPARAAVRVHEYGLTPGLLATTHVWIEGTGEVHRVAAKGAPETIAALCALAPDEAKCVLDAASRMAERGLRVLAVASATWSGDRATLPLSPRGFRFEWRGLVGLADPLRDGVPAAVAEAQAAGVRIVMLTGDHPETAKAIAAQAGLARSAVVVTGDALARLGEEEFAATVASVDVFARVRPEEKLRLVRALKAAGAVVAMTGDGVNDAPALVAAHVGVAMGGRGTDVAREAASIVLLDDDFVTVVTAIRQGRAIYDNLLRAMRYILAVHVPIIGMALLPLLIGAPLILLPLHIVFLELIIDPASTLVFEREPAAVDVMRRPPRRPDRNLIHVRMALGSVVQGLVVLLAVAAVYAGAKFVAATREQAAALAFTTLVAGNLGLIALNRTRGNHRWLPLGNSVHLVVVIAALAMLTLATRSPHVAIWFGFAPPPWGMFAAALATPVGLLMLLDGLRRDGPASRP